MRQIDLLEALFELVPDALLVVDDAGTIVQANGHAARLFDFPPERLVGLRVEALLPPSLRAIHRRHRSDYMARPRVRPMGGNHMALVGLRRDGTRFPVEISLGPLGDDGGGPRYLASVRDISESERTRRTLARAGHDALLARIGRLALAATNVDEVVAMLPGQLSEALGTQVTAIVFGTTAKTCRVAAAHGIAPDALTRLLRDAPRGVLEDAMRGDDPHVVRRLFAQAQADMGTPAPCPCPGDGVAMPMSDRGQPLGVLLVLDPEPARLDADALHLVRLVTELLATLVGRRRTEEQLAHAQRREALGQLTGGVAHDFNNVLTLVSGHLEQLEGGQDLPEAARHDIAQARRAVGRGVALTSALLSFARRQHLAPHAIPAGEVLAGLASMLGRTMGAGVRIRTECARGVADVFVDPAQLETALVNLAFNARDAMPGGGEITLSADAPQAPPSGAEAGPLGRFVVIGVSDTGTGMTDETLARAVEPYFTTRPGGTGLGLSMVYGFVKQSGGYLHIDSRPGHGTRVALHLPVAKPAST
jgi:PAS domain S-box-containing protein